VPKGLGGFKGEALFGTILTRYCPDLMCILDCDYQDQTLGTVLSQKHPGEKVERVLAYSSRTLKRAELKYSPTEGELLALLHGLKAFRQYLAGRSRFLARTDHWALNGFEITTLHRAGWLVGCVKSTHTLSSTLNTGLGASIRCRTACRGSLRPI
jgi:hypothetical protein